MGLTYFDKYLLLVIATLCFEANHESHGKLSTKE